jgi:hypothetical protein
LDRRYLAIVKVSVWVPRLRGLDGEMSPKKKQRLLPVRPLRCHTNAANVSSPFLDRPRNGLRGLARPDDHGLRIVIEHLRSDESLQDVIVGDDDANRSAAGCWRCDGQWTPACDAHPRRATATGVGGLPSSHCGRAGRRAIRTHAVA